MATENVGDAFGLRCDVGEGQPRAAAVAVFPQESNAARIFGELVDDLGEIEMLWRLPAEVAMLAPIVLDRFCVQFVRL